MEIQGDALVAADYEALERRWVDRTSADHALLRRANSVLDAELIGRKIGDYSGIIILYVWPGEAAIREVRLRRDHPDVEQDASGSLKLRNKYMSPPGRGNMLYFVPGTDPHAAGRH